MAPNQKLKFNTTLLQTCKTATGIKIPPEIIEKLGAGKKPAVKVNINGFTYRSTVAVMSGAFMVRVNAENREQARVKIFETLSYSKKTALIYPIAKAKKDETRNRNIGKALYVLLSSKK